MTEAGYYDDGSGRQRWWDGNQWTDNYQDEEQSVTEEPVLTFTSTISGEDSVVSVFPNRMEWAKKTGGVSAKKITAGIFTGGLSLAATGVGKDGYSAKKSTNVSILQLDAVTGITSAKDGRYVTVTVSTPSMALPMNLSKKEAEQVARTLNNLVAAAKTPKPTAAPVTVQVAAPAPTPAAAPDSGGGDPTARLQQLAELHQQGILSADEFAAAKAKALGI